MLRICPGYASSAICGPVARAGAVQAGKKPQQCQVTAYSPGCGVNALPGLRITSNLWPGSPGRSFASREEAAAMPRHGIFPGLRRKRLTRATGYPAYSPGCGVNALPGLRVTSNLRFGSPAKRSASREEAAAMPRHGIFPGLRRKRLTRATGYRQSAVR